MKQSIFCIELCLCYIYKKSIQVPKQFTCDTKMEEIKMQRTAYKYLLVFLFGSIGLSLSSLTYAQNPEMERYQAALIELKNTQKQLMEKLTDEDKENFITSQRHWNRFKNSDCLNLGVNPLYCLESRTKERTQHLKDFLKNLSTEKST
ncbi:MAG: DUF1311 domain-containing protein [Nitrosomonas oligotropha]|uniref:DUF1311 domain-containing protein n=2 Tax=Nitrosomonas oligotropha TaxID=42354 RepID=A0A5C7VXB5_9PROT|nr:MAG: DUF1311 domain-containing protein [Nitrosomonas oligotropha]